jgi:hypothetical protein
MTRRRHEPEPEPEPKYIKAGEELYRYIKSMMLFKLSSRLWRNIQKNRRPKFPISFLLLKLLRREHLWYRVGRSFRLGRAGTTSSIMINKWVTLHHLAEPGGPREKDFQTLYDISIFEDDITIDINLPEHIRLQTNHEALYLNSGLFYGIFGPDEAASRYKKCLVRHGGEQAESVTEFCTYGGRLAYKKRKKRKQQPLWVSRREPEFETFRKPTELEELCLRQLEMRATDNGRIKPWEL